MDVRRFMIEIYEWDWRNGKNKAVLFEGQSAIMEAAGRAMSEQTDITSGSLTSTGRWIILCRRAFDLWSRESWTRQKSKNAAGRALIMSRRRNPEMEPARVRSA